jgi:hypothetical protein
MDFPLLAKLTLSSKVAAETGNIATKALIGISLI